MAPQNDDILAVVRISGINQRSALEIKPKPYRWGGMVHRKGFDLELGEGKMAFPALIEKERISLGFDPSAVNALELQIEIFKARGANQMKRQGASKIYGVIQGKKERNEVRDMIRVKMGNGLVLNLAEIQAQSGHLP